MKGKFGLVKAILSWSLMVAFLVVGVIATQNGKLNFDGNFKFDATDVKAEIVVKQALGKEVANLENISFVKVGNTIKIDEENQVADNIVLGNEGMIEFTSENNAYYLQIEIKNMFKPGGRDILVDYSYFDGAGIEWFSSSEEIKHLDGSDADYTEDFLHIVLAPEKTLVILIGFVLDTDKSGGFDTTNLEGGIEFAWVSLQRN